MLSRVKTKKNVKSYYCCCCCSRPILTSKLRRQIEWALCYYLRQGERSERWKRLRNWSFCPSFYVHGDSSSSPCVIKRWRTPVKTSTFYSSNVQITSLRGDMHSHECLLVNSILSQSQHQSYRIPVD